MPDMVVRIDPAPQLVLGAGSLVISDSVVSLADVTWNGTVDWEHIKGIVKHAEISVENDDFRFWEDGEDPADDDGMYVDQYSSISWMFRDTDYNTQLNNLRMIRVDTDSTIMVTVYN